MESFRRAGCLLFPIFLKRTPDDGAASPKAVETGRRVRRREGVYFTSIEAARNLLTPNRLALLRAIRTRRPGSIYELAKVVGGDLTAGSAQLRAYSPPSESPRDLHSIDP